METREAFGQEIARLRAAKGISQRKLAELVDLSPGFLSRLERGLFSPPSDEKIEALATILGVDRDALLAKAGRASKDLEKSIVKNPELMASLVRRLGELDPDSLAIAIALTRIFIVVTRMVRGSHEFERDQRELSDANNIFRKECERLDRTDQNQLLDRMMQMVQEQTGEPNAF
ncbi:MAG TPA: helix-turn-helix transcriptional regulator [Candidatus Fermentibacter daniensis]|nr:helix-turn-helix transcriptional regulator [Candidatus Fermentibacter daniensis]HOR07086.1 helix-turn-helix transcriptional regulator [Candidatus Fermentibacter daniensis]HPK52295.1 helix-turn-helix transcriptional regulator [Candidatus Fermentibacter daniensis]